MDSIIFSALTVYIVNTGPVAAYKSKNKNKSALDVINTNSCYGAVLYGIKAIENEF